MTHMMTRSRGLAMAVAMLLFAGGNSGEAAAPAGAALPVPPLVNECAPGIRGGRLVLSTFGDPKTFNPIASNEGSSEDIYRFIFSSLLTLDMPSQKMLPSLAEKWSVAADQITAQYKDGTG